MQRPSVRPFLRAALLLGIALSLPQCAGYRVGAVKPAEFDGINTIAVPTFKNDTLEQRIDTLVTGAVIKEFQNDGTYTIASTANADAILRGTIKTIDRNQLRSARFNTLRSRELRVRMEVEYVLEEAQTGLILDRGTVRGDTNIFLDPNFQLTERQAIYDMSIKLAADLVSRLAEGWPGMDAPAPGSVPRGAVDEPIDASSADVERIR